VRCPIARDCGDRRGPRGEIAWLRFRTSFIGRARFPSEGHRARAFSPPLLAAAMRKSCKNSSLQPAMPRLSARNARAPILELPMFDNSFVIAQRICRAIGCDGIVVYRGRRNTKRRGGDTARFGRASKPTSRSPAPPLPTLRPTTSSESVRTGAMAMCKNSPSGWSTY
jgi:hypothetical protein